LDEDDAYDLALILLKDNKAKGHTISIIEWIIAHNLLQNKVNVPYHTIEEIDNMTQSEINQLAKKLGIKGNNRENIYNILRFLHKLDELDELLPEIKDIILNNLNELELKDIKISDSNFNDIINLLKTHRNKALIRKFVYDDMDKIIFNNIEIVNDNGIDGVNGIDQINMDNLVNFIINLLEIKETDLAKKAINIIHEYKLESYRSIDYYLVEKLVFETNIKVLKKSIDIIGEDDILKNFRKIIDILMQGSKIKGFLENLVKLHKYDFLIKIVQVLIDEDFMGNKRLLPKILQKIKNAIRSKNDDLIIRYVDIISKMNIINSIKSGNRQANAIHLEIFNKLINEAEEFEDK